MKTLHKLLSAVVLVLALGVSAFAQSTTTQTILSSAITSATQNVIVVGSATGISASTQTTEYDLWVDGEFMKVTAVSGTNITVIRGYRFSRGTVHPANSIVFAGVAGPSPFITQNPYPGSSCTSTAYTYLPLVNVRDGTVSNCLTSARGGIWVQFAFQNYTFGHPLVSIPDTAYTATLADEYVVYKNMTTARTATLPTVTGVIGKVMVVKHNGPSFTLTVAAPNGQFIGTTGTASITLTNGMTTKLISIQSSNSAWGWATID